MTNVEIDKLVGNTCKKIGYKKTRQRCSWLQSPFCQNEKNENELEHFYRFLKRNISKRTTVKDQSEMAINKETTTVTKKKVPKLKFEVNFDFDDIKVSNKSSVKAKKKVETAKEKQREPEVVPKKFLKHILALGFEEVDGPLLYEHKEQWIGVELDSKIKCTELGCKFEIEMQPNCLVEHCKSVHEWRDYPCEYKKKFHDRLRGSHLAWKCDIAGCEASFYQQADLKRHMDVHKNLSFDCHLCPYRNSHKVHIKSHLDNHFGNKMFKCDWCEMSFTRRRALAEHIEYIHEAIQYKCPLCKKIGNMKVIRSHLCYKHNTKSTFDRKKNQFVLHEKFQFESSGD